MNISVCSYVPKVPETDKSNFVRFFVILLRTFYCNKNQTVRRLDRNDA